jgi:hypothetical protein
MFEDPEGYQAYLANSVRETVLNQTLNISEEMTRQQVGAELVDEATTWAKQAFQANPGFYQAFVQQRNPYGFLVGEYQRQQALSQIGSTPHRLPPSSPGNRLSRPRRSRGQPHNRNSNARQARSPLQPPLAEECSTRRPGQEWRSITS